MAQAGGQTGVEALHEAEAALLAGERDLCHDGVHWNERGACVLARALARWLGENVYR